MAGDHIRADIILGPPLDERTRHQARLHVASRAQDPKDLRQLLNALGLTPETPTDQNAA